MAQPKENNLRNPSLPDIRMSNYLRKSSLGTYTASAVEDTGTSILNVSNVIDAANPATRR